MLKFCGTLIRYYGNNLLHLQSLMSIVVGNLALLYMSVTGIISKSVYLK